LTNPWFDGTILTENTGVLAANVERTETARLTGAGDGKRNKPAELTQARLDLYSHRKAECLTLKKELHANIFDRQVSIKPNGTAANLQERAQR
jgi:hypothetical protein